MKHYIYVLALACLALGCDKSSSRVELSPSGVNATQSQQLKPNTTEIKQKIIVTPKSEVDVQLVSYGDVSPKSMKQIDYPGKPEVVGLKSESDFQGWAESAIFKGKMVRGVIVKIESAKATNVVLSSSTVTCILKQTNAAPYFFQPIAKSDCKLSASADENLAQINPLLESFNWQSDLRFAAVLGQNVAMTIDFQKGGSATIGIAFETFGQVVDGLKILNKTFTISEIQSKRVGIGQ